MIWCKMKDGQNVPIAPEHVTLIVPLPQGAELHFVGGTTLVVRDAIDLLVSAIEDALSPVDIRLEEDCSPPRTAEPEAVGL